MMKKVDWSDPEQVKEYHRLHYLANREKHLKQMKNWRETHKEEKKASNREYRVKNMVTKYYGYGGVCVCPKCGLKGYKNYYRIFNKKTGHYCNIETRVHHQHTEDGKTVYDSACYIGVGEL